MMLVNSRANNMLRQAFMSSSYNNIVFRAMVMVAPFFLFGLINGTYNAALAVSPVLFWIVDICGWVFLPTTILYFLYKQYGIRLSDYGLTPLGSSYQRRELLGWTLLATFILSIYYFAFGWLAWQFTDDVEPLFGYAQVVPDGVWHYVVVFYLAITAALFEEIFYRGLIWRLIYTASSIHHKSFIYLVVSSGLFGIVHWENGPAEVFSATVFGFVACILYLRLRNLIPLMVAHFLVDVINFM